MTLPLTIAMNNHDARIAALVLDALGYRYRASPQIVAHPRRGERVPEMVAITVEEGPAP